MDNIFNKEITPKEPFGFVKVGLLTINTGNETPATSLLAIGFQWNYTQQQMPISIIGDEGKILTDVPGEGTINITQIVSEQTLQNLFPPAIFEDGATGVTMSISGAKNNSKIERVFHNCVMSSTGDTIGAEAPYIQRQIAIRFSHMGDSGATGAAQQNSKAVYKPSRK